MIIDASRKNEKILLALTLFLLLFLIYFLASSYPRTFTKEKLKDAAIIAKTRDLPNGYCFANTFDWWNNRICILREKSENNNFIAYTALSSGKDGIPENNDDITYTTIQWNKSQIIGQWLGEKSKEATKGFWKGLKKESQF